MNNFQESLGSKGHLTRTCLEGWGKTRQLWLESSLSMRLSYFPPLRSAWNFQLPFPPQGETFLLGEGGRGVRPIASRRLLCAILSTNQMLKLKQSRLGHPRFPAFRLIYKYTQDLWGILLKSIRFFYRNVQNIIHFVSKIKHQIDNT